MSNLIRKNEKGFVLPVGLMFLAIITLLGTTAVVVTTTDLKIGSNYKQSVQAFCDADAGGQYTISMIEDGLANDTLDLSGSSVTVNYTAPAGFSFDTITTLTQVGTTSNYSFQVTGHSGNANSAIEVVFARDYLFEYGAFGDKKLHMKHGADVYSYDSSVDSLPLIAMPLMLASTGEGNVGSNGEVRVNAVVIDGNVGLGDDDGGNEAVYHETGGSVTTGQVEDVPRINPDPLGAIGGDLADDFVFYSDSANNDNASVGITGNTISLGADDAEVLAVTDAEAEVSALTEDLAEASDPAEVSVLTAALTLAESALATAVLALTPPLTLTAGNNYYLDSIELKNAAILNIDGTGGEVNIYLTGKLDAKHLSCINITGHPTKFTIFSNSSDKIDFKSASNFRGTVYAPYADLDVKHCAGIYGMIWAKNIDIKNLASVCFDTALKDKWPADTVSIVSWREILN